MLLQYTALIDSHCHLDLSQFEADRAAVLVRAREAGVRCIVNPGIDLDHCRHALALAEEYAEVYVAVGIHPNSAHNVDAQALDDLRALAAHPKVVAVGEIGLDYYWKDVDPATQRRAFVAQLELAAELGLPVIIHNRDASEDVADVLRSWAGSNSVARSPLAQRPFKGVLHAFGGELQLAEEAYEWGFVIGLGGPVTFRNARELHALVPRLRLDRLMLETDAPYLTPHPHRGQRNEPGYVKLVCEQVAQLRGMEPAEVAALTTATAARFFQLEDRFGADPATRHTAVHA